MAKRKRESNAAGTDEAATPSASSKAGPSSKVSTPAKADRKGKGKQVDDGGASPATGPLISYSSADGSQWWSEPLSKHLVDRKVHAVMVS